MQGYEPEGHHPRRRFLTMMNWTIKAGRDSRDVPAAFELHVVLPELSGVRNHSMGCDIL